LIHKEGGILSVDDTVIEKLYSDPKSAELVNYFWSGNWSGKFHQTIKGINLVTLYYSDLNGNSVPVNYRIYDKEVLDLITRPEFLMIHDTHWGIESFHRAIKQVCGIGRFQVRNSLAIKTHIFCSLHAFVRLEIMRSEQMIANWYELQKNLFTSVIREYIVQNLPQSESPPT